MERRKFLIGAAAGGVGLLEYSSIARWMDSLGDPWQPEVEKYQKYGAKAALMAITPNSDFYLTTKGTSPRVDAARWELKFEGLVAHPFSITYKELLALPSFERVMTLECISNPIGGNAIGNARWKGTALKPLLERAKPLPEAANAAIYAADGFSTGHPLERLMNDENFLAYRMNGVDLPVLHGYPARVFIPGKFGMKQPKWVTRIELVNKAYLGYWESRGWSNSAERRAQARFTDIRDGAKIEGKNFELTGYAVGNLAGIKTVEISFNQGKTWQPADLYSNPSNITWAFWKYIWVDPTPGKYKIAVRAIDGQGNIEGPEPTGIFPSGATGYEVIHVRVA